MKRSKNLIFVLAGLAVVGLVQLLSTNPSLAAITYYFNDLSGFNTAAGNPPIAINFDNIAAGTTINNNQTINGVTFQGPGAPLVVVKAADTHTPSSGWDPLFAQPISTNRLFATSGENVLSPGGIVLVPGPNNAVEIDSLTLIFTKPVKAFGFDLLYQSLDGFSLTAITIKDSNNNILFGAPYTNPNAPDYMIPSSHPGDLPGGSDFWGFVSDTTNIAKIEIVESDSDNRLPDSNIGYDTFRFQPAAAPLPGSFLLLASGLLGLVGLRKNIKL